EAADKAPKAAQDAKVAATEKGHGAQKKAEGFIENVRDAVAKKAHAAQKVVGEEAQYLKKLADDKAHEAGKLSEKIKKTMFEKAREAQEAVTRQAENIRHGTQEQVDKKEQLEKMAKEQAAAAKSAVDKETEYVADVTHKKKEQLEKLTKEQADAAKLAAQQKEKEARKLTDRVAHMAQETYDEAARKAHETYDAAAEEANEIKAKVVKSAHDADQAIRHQAEEATHQAQKAFGHVEEQTEKAEKAARKQAKELKKSAEEMVHDGQEYLDVPAEAATNAKEFVVQHVKDAGDQAAEAKEAAKQKVLNAHTASKASLAAMIAGIEEMFGHFYDYEDTETKTLWSKLQSAIDEHVEGAKKSAHDLERANREAYESFESYVRDWRNQGGDDLEDRIAKLKQQSVESVKRIGQRAEEDQTAAKSKVNVLANNVDVYLNGLKDFLADRLEASKETVASELSVFKDTSSKDDEETVRGKLTQLEAAARTRLDEAGRDAHAKAQQLLKQVDEIWSKSEAQSRELAEKTQALAKKASEDARLSIQYAAGVAEEKGAEAEGAIKDTMQSVKEAAANRAQEATGKMQEILHERKDDSGGVDTDNIRIALEEPGSGHRHHRH
ncbi:hypothetical protein BGX23_002615, partial [Mortierella sp. AD031]